MNARLSSLCLLVVAFAVGCDKPAPKPEVKEAVVDAGPAKPAEVVVTVLFTGSENGYLLPVKDEQGVERGGVAPMLAHWNASEGEASSRLVLSTGDNANGAAISSLFLGQSTAELMKHLGYAASAFGHHELDFPAKDFTDNAQRAGVTYLAANLTASSDEAKALGLKPYAVFERNGVKLGVVGLSNRRAPNTVLPGRYAGLQVTESEAALNDAVPAAWKDGAAAVVVVMDGCLNEVTEALNKHPEWKLAAVAGRKCAAEVPAKVGGTHLLAPGPHFSQYARLKLTIDPSKPAQSQVRESDAATLDVVSGGSGPTADASTLELLKPWQAKLQEVLGEQIGFSKKGLKATDAKMAKWVAEAMKDQSGAEVALVNKKGLRQDLPAGAVTKATIYDVIPFEDSVVKVTLTPEQLKAVMANDAAVVVGASKAMLAGKKNVTLATTDYLYFGGDGFALEKNDPNADFTGVDWRTAVIEWTTKAKSTEKKPLESLIK